MVVGGGGIYTQNTQNDFDINLYLKLILNISISEPTYLKQRQVM